MFQLESKIQYDFSSMQPRGTYNTTKVMPQMARKPEIQWPVQNDHCFQRIILDAVCNGTWYNYLERPAYKNLTQDQAFRAVQLCEEIVAGRANLHDLNRQSLIWRGKKIR
jgi:hypothetical protein